MKTTKLLSLLALLSIITVATASAAPITFDPTNPLIVSNQGGFTGTGTSPGLDYSQVRLRFSFSGLFPTSFVISGISVAGPGIDTSLSIPNVTITGDGDTFSDFVTLNTAIKSVDFTAGFVASFSLPGGAINDGATLTLSARYADPTDDQRATSLSGPIYLSEVPPPPAAIPEPASVGMLLFGAAAVYSFRRRRDDV
jgi:hypothetical protein